jgi:hypothetical protein
MSLQQTVRTRTSETGLKNCFWLNAKPGKHCFFHANSQPLKASEGTKQVIDRRSLIMNIEHLKVSLVEAFTVWAAVYKGVNQIHLA